MKQTKQIEVEFQTEHNPGTPEHLEVVLANYLRSKGVTYEDGQIIV